MKKVICFVIIFCFLVTVTGCATIVSGRTQRIPVMSSPSGAIVTIGSQKQMTPATFILDKQQEYVVRIEKEGYEPVEIVLKKTLSGWVFGNVFFGILGGAIGVVIDIGNGSAMKIVPSPVEVQLLKAQLGEHNLEDKTLLFVQEPKKEKQPVSEKQQKITSYAEYYRLLYRMISSVVVKPEGRISGTINATFTLLNDGTLEETKILEGSSEDAALRKAVEDAIKNSAPFPAFPDEIKEEPRRTFSITIEFKNR